MKEKEKEKEEEEETKTETKDNKEPGKDRTVYVSGLPWSTDEKQLVGWFNETVNLPRSSIESIVFPKWQDSGNSRGYALICFHDENSAKLAIKASGKELGKRYLVIEPAMGPRKRRRSESIPSDCCVLFVKNLPYDTDEEEVEEIFQPFGKVASVRLSRWNHTGRLKGFGYIEFKKASTVSSILKQDKEVTLRGRRLRCDVETNPTPRQSFRDSAGQQWFKKKKVTNKHSS